MQKRTLKLIQIDWQGPFVMNELNLLTNDSQDYGIYQIYGKHIVYGKDVLLYIGKADQQTIGKGVSQEKWWWDTNDSNLVKIYAGRIAGENTPEEDTWSKEIDLAEKLLINVHKLAYNSKSLTFILNAELQDIHILNWGDHRDLLPEISGLRWTSKLDTMEYDIYRYTAVE